MNTKQCVIIGLVILLAILFLYNKQENADFSGTLSNEALQNIAKVYADKDGTVSFNNILLTGGIKSPTDKYRLVMQDNGDLAIYDVNNKKNIWFAGTSGTYSLGPITTDSNITTSKNIIASGDGSFIKAFGTSYINNTGESKLDGPINTVSNITTSQNIIASGDGSWIKAFGTSYVNNTGAYYMGDNLYWPDAGKPTRWKAR